MPRIRVDIKPHNQQFLLQIASQMECNNPTEVINYLLLELRKMGYSFNTQFPQITAPPLEAMPHSAMAYEPIQEPEVDPAIAKLLAIGLQEF